MEWISGGRGGHHGTNRLRPVGNRLCPQPQGQTHAEDDLAGGVIVVDNQDARTGQGSQAQRRRIRSTAGLQTKSSREEEMAALTGRTVDADISAHQPHQTAAYSQPKPLPP
jgi:hypothetical protein